MRLPWCVSTALLIALDVWCSAAPRAQTTWNTVTVPAGLARRNVHGLVFDEKRGTMVLFGGCNSMRCFADTWTFDGTNWTNVASGGPAARSGFGMVYDAAREVIVLFGGGTGSALFRDTWTWNGTSWTQVATSGPTPRWNVGMAYDPVRQKTVLVGGANFSNAFRETWEWDGAQWTLVSIGGPTARVSPGCAWDGNRGGVLLYGGADVGQNPLPADTWLWDGVAWTQIAVPGPTYAAAPSLGMYAVSMAWNPATRRVVLFGGTVIIAPTITGACSSDTWEWDGTSWTKRAPGSPPQPRAWTTIAYDPRNDTMLVHGGVDYTYLGPGHSFFTVLADAHAYASVYPASLASVGNGCPGTAGTPLLATEANARAWTGDNLTLELTGLPAAGAATITLGASAQSFGGIPLPIVFAPQGAPGCALWSSIELAVPVANVGGTASLTFAIPVNPLLLGNAFYAQGLAQDTGANPLGLIASNSLALTVGSR
jgi:hypothetical protein